MNGMLKRGFLSSLGVGLACIVYGVSIERTRVEVNEIEIRLANLPSEFEGFSIVQLSDFHHGKFVSLGYIKKCLKLASQLRPDIFVLTGDYVDTEEDYIIPLAESLKTYATSIPTYAVLGNHEHWMDARFIVEKLKLAGVNVLINQNVPIQRNDARIWLLGVDDIEGDFRPGMAVRGTNQDEVKVLLAHNPCSIDFAVKRKIDLLLCGHTHGGQITLPLLGPIFLNGTNGKRYPSGLFQIEKTQMYVSKGLGVSILPIRFRTRPEITYFKIYQEN